MNNFYLLSILIKKYLKLRIKNTTLQFKIFFRFFKKRIIDSSSELIILKPYVLQFLF